MCEVICCKNVNAWTGHRDSIIINPQNTNIMDNKKDKTDQGLNEIIRNNVKKDEALNKLYSQLSASLPTEDEYELEKHVDWGPQKDNLTYDIVVRRKRYITVVINLYEGETDELLLANSRKVFENTPASLSIVYWGIKELYYLYRADDNTYINGIINKTESENLDDVIAAIKDASVKNPSGAANQIGTLDTANQHESPVKEYNLKFREEKVLDPEWCREKLGLFSDEICRYTSLEYLFSILRYGCFRMNGLPGMNDKFEGLFAWNIINDEQRLTTEVIKKRKGLINNAFIVSFSHIKKLDDLYQWRLYGEESKGVCCVFSIKEDKIKDRFFLHQVKYIEAPKKGQSPSDSILAELKQYVDNQSDLDNSDLSPIIYFYKNASYASEEEIRLLVDNKNTSAYDSFPYRREWLLTNSNKIPNPYIDVPLKDFPLKLERILLGPNMNDVDTIQAQLETMLEQQDIDAKVELSNIDSYRNPTR